MMVKGDRDRRDSEASGPTPRLQEKYGGGQMTWKLQVTRRFGDKKAPIPNTSAKVGRCQADKQLPAGLGLRVRSGTTRSEIRPLREPQVRKARGPSPI